ncbi:putative xyloglucan endotransglucosylase/hydrolase protein 33 [Iris pallida]|uniref:Xyloglucan endotransglucosylase/hydrolase n=1 Tax=Iris pallida TaxID=29817 RepID=A0AAX6DT34_IRIPA|nr:putative xyloglucan endotransglucosylase/hydrolase protein 33 [Iris pallida]
MLRFCKLALLLVSLTSLSTTTRSTRHGLIPPTATRLTDRFPCLPYDKAFSSFFGGKNVQLANDGSGVSLALDKTSGSGFKSREMYYYGFFSAAIRLPSDYSAGVVVAFYMSNAEVFPKSHDEIDFELLGHEKRKEWVLQTNVYGNGSVGTGREEKFYLWFDPTEDHHQYSILWNYHHIVFLVDNIPVREVSHTDAMSGAYPSKPMSVYSTIWDGSEWATHGGKKPTDYKFAPFVASFRDLEADGCPWSQTKSASPCSTGNRTSSLSLDPVGGAEFAKLSQQQEMGLDWTRSKFMFYSYCKDPHRFSVMPPECKP